MKRISLISMLFFVISILGCFGLSISTIQAEEAQDVSSPADDQSSFIIGSNTYTVNGVAKSMEVTPYIKNSRTFLPIRYAAYAIGIEDQDIIWHRDSQSIMLIKGLQTVELTIGSKTITINSVTTQQIDAAPEIRNGRTCLPVALVARAFGATVEWDAVSQRATITASDAGDQQNLTEGSIDERLALYLQAQIDCENKFGIKAELGPPYGEIVYQTDLVTCNNYDADAEENRIMVARYGAGGAALMNYRHTGVGQWELEECNMGNEVGGTD